MQRQPSYQHGVVLTVVQVHAEARVVGVQLQHIFNGSDRRRHKEGIHWFAWQAKEPKKWKTGHKKQFQTLAHILSHNGQTVLKLNICREKGNSDLVTPLQGFSISAFVFFIFLKSAHLPYCAKMKWKYVQSNCSFYFFKRVQFKKDSKWIWFIDLFLFLLSCLFVLLLKLLEINQIKSVSPGWKIT